MRAAIQGAEVVGPGLYTLLVLPASLERRRLASESTESLAPPTREDRGMEPKLHPRSIVIIRIVFSDGGPEYCDEDCVTNIMWAGEHAVAPLMSETTYGRITFPRERGRVVTVNVGKSSSDYAGCDSSACVFPVLPCVCPCARGVTLLRRCPFAVQVVSGRREDCQRNTGPVGRCLPTVWVPWVFTVAHRPTLVAERTLMGAVIGHLGASACTTHGRDMHAYASCMTTQPPGCWCSGCWCCGSLHPTGIDPMDFDHQAYYQKGMEKCEWAGLGAVGSGWTIQQGPSPFILMHELGHNVGLSASPGHSLALPVF